MRSRAAGVAPSNWPARTRNEVWSSAPAVVSVESPVSRKVSTSTNGNGRTPTAAAAMSSSGPAPIAGPTSGTGSSSWDRPAGQTGWGGSSRASSAVRTSVSASVERSTSGRSSR